MPALARKGKYLLLLAILSYLAIVIFMSTIGRDASDLEKQNQGDEATAQVSEKREREVSQIWEFFHGDYTVDMILDEFPRELLPTLVDLMTDESHSHYRSRYTLAIAFLEEPQVAYETIHQYIVRPEEYLDFQSIDGKYNTIHKLGLVDTPESEEFLRYTLTANGADSLMRNWGTLKDVKKWWEGNPRPYIRGNAAMGLVLTQKPENIALVESLYHELVPQARLVASKYQEPRSYNSSRPEVDRDFLTLFEEVVDVLAFRDLIDERGLDKVMRESYFNGWAHWDNKAKYEVY